MIPIQHLDWTSVPSETLSPQLERQYINTEHVTVARFLLKKGVIVPMHHHPNEQIAFVVSGALKFTVDGKEVLLRAGEVLCIAPNVPHSAEAMEDTVDVDVFTPPRADWLSKDDAYLR